MQDAQLEALSPFELSLYLQKHVVDPKRQQVLDAGRGNPNWTAPVPREAFFLLGEFATQETQQGGLTGTMVMPAADRLARFLAFLQTRPGAGATFLEQLLALSATDLGMPAAAWLDAACDAIIGDNYPAPARCLPVCEHPLKAYLQQNLFGQAAPAFDVFPVEGGTAGICYLFDTLINTHLLEPGARIALLLPTFAPYLEITKLPQYHFDVVAIRSTQTRAAGRTTYHYPAAELDKLRDPLVTAVFVVNPSNPTANALGAANIRQIQTIVNEARPDLMILTDDVYGTFASGFQSLFAVLPRNTVCLYSFSKYFGATGWRVGAIAMAQDNVFDRLLQQLPPAQAATVAARYAAVTSDAPLPFIDRLVADSRDIALNHAAGLSAVQQVMIALFSLYGCLVDGAAYQAEVMAICRTREKQLFATLGLPLPETRHDTAYYCELDLMAWIQARYGQAFAAFVKTRYSPRQLLVQLAADENVMLLQTRDFGSHPWAVRISLANLATRQYAQIGARLIHWMDDLQVTWTNKRGQSNE